MLDLDLSWLRPIERLLRRVAADVPGAHVERKSCSVAWHYRQAEPEYGSWRARELAQRPPSAPRGRTGRGARRTPGRRGAGARRRQGRLRAKPLSRRQGADALRPGARRRPDRPRPPRRPASGLDRRPRWRPPPEPPQRQRAAGGHPRRRARERFVRSCATSPRASSRPARRARVVARGACGAARGSTTATP